MAIASSSGTARSPPWGAKGSTLATTMSNPSADMPAGSTCSAVTPASLSAARVSGVAWSSMPSDVRSRARSAIASPFATESRARTSPPVPLGGLPAAHRAQSTARRAEYRRGAMVGGEQRAAAGDPERARKSPGRPLLLLEQAVHGRRAGQLPRHLRPDLGRGGDLARADGRALQRPCPPAAPPRALAGDAGVAALDRSRHLRPDPGRHDLPVLLPVRAAVHRHRHRGVHLDPLLPLPALHRGVQRAAPPGALLLPEQVQGGRVNGALAPLAGFAPPALAARRRVESVEIRRFGPGQRRPEGPPGTRGVSGAMLMSDERAVVTEVAFGPYAMITPHSNETNTALFIVISGGGFVQVGEERARVNHGEAVLWPPGVPHGAYTDGTEMRAIIVELVGEDGRVVDAAAGHGTGATPAEKAKGALAERQRTRAEYDSAEGEPW